MYGDGSTKRDYTFVDDIVSGIISAIEYKESDFEISNDTKDTLKIKIQDNGKGIEQENLSKLFKPFFHSRLNNVSGSGLGLAITKKLTNLLKGKIEVISEIGLPESLANNPILPSSHPFCQHILNSDESTFIDDIRQIHA